MSGVASSQGFFCHIRVCKESREEEIFWLLYGLVHLGGKLDCAEGLAVFERADVHKRGHTDQTGQSGQKNPPLPCV